jgi:peptide/nickel transport system substrate-binding protein
MKRGWRGGRLAVASAVRRPRRGGAHRRWAASGDPNTMDPHSQNVGTVTMVLQQIYDALIARNRTCRCARAWRRSGAGGAEPAGASAAPGVRFHEGEAFTAEDVVFSIQRALQPTSNYGIFVDTIERAVGWTTAPWT